jgi:hypothetical protein
MGNWMHFTGVGSSAHVFGAFVIHRCCRDWRCYVKEPMMEGPEATGSASRRMFKTDYACRLSSAAWHHRLEDCVSLQPFESQNSPDPFLSFFVLTFLKDEYGRQSRWTHHDSLKLSGSRIVPNLAWP